MSTTVLADFRLSRRLRVTLAPLARVVCPPDAEALDLIEPIIDQMELHMRAIPTFLRVGLSAGITGFEVGAVARHGKPFSRCTPAQQEAYFKAWWESPVMALHQFAKGVKGLLAMGYYELPIVRERMAYHPERWIAEVAARRLDKYGADVRAHDALVVAPDPLLAPATLLKKVTNEAA